jgi:hypothetical protein
MIGSLRSLLDSFGPFPLVLAATFAAVLLAWLTGALRWIPNSRVGIVEKLWSARGSVASGHLIARRGEAGYQPDVLRGGIHFMMPLQYRVHSVPLVTIPQGQIGYVFARDGVPLAPTQTLGGGEETFDAGDAAGFLARGGQRDGALRGGDRDGARRRRAAHPDRRRRERRGRRRRGRRQPAAGAPRDAAPRAHRRRRRGAARRLSRLSVEAQVGRAAGRHARCVHLPRAVHLAAEEHELPAQCTQAPA